MTYYLLVKIIWVKYCPSFFECIQFEEYLLIINKHFPYIHYYYCYFNIKFPNTVKSDSRTTRSVYDSLLPTSGLWDWKLVFTDTSKMVIPLDELMGALNALRSFCFMNLNTRGAENEWSPRQQGNVMFWPDACVLFLLLFAFIKWIS